MKHNHDVPLIHASVCKPIILAAQAIGTPINKILQSVNLTSQILDEPFLLVPEIAAWNLVHAIGELEGEPLFGLKATTELAVYDYESIKYLIYGCINLKALLERFCAIAPTVCSNDNYVLEEDGDKVWLIQKGVRIISNHRQVELFEIGGMMQLVQLAAGEDWRPTEIHLVSSYCHHTYSAKLLNPSRIFFSKKYPAIAIPRLLLTQEIPLVGDDDDAVSIAKLANTIEGRLSQAIMPYVGKQMLDTQLLSDISGMSFRSLQRKLAENGTSYSMVLEQARFQKAQCLLRETNEKMIGISFTLGYENPSAFSRAFKRWAGVSPREYRDLVRQP